MSADRRQQINFMIADFSESRSARKTRQQRLISFMAYALGRVPCAVRLLRHNHKKNKNAGRFPVLDGRYRTYGFTLMEVLIAIAILAIVVTTVLASFNSVFSTTEVLDESAEIYEMAKSCLGRLTLDLEEIYIAQRPIYKPPELDQAPDPYRMVATSKDIDGTGFAQFRFTSKAHVRLEKSRREGIAEIIYYVQARDDGHPVLKRADNLYPYPAFEEKGSDPVLCKYVKSLAFKFYDNDGNEFDVWDSDSDEFGYATPQAIAVKLELARKTAVYTFETMVFLPIFREKIE
jgi:general secretion pathway protein J